MFILILNIVKITQMHIRTNKKGRTGPNHNFGALILIKHISHLLYKY